VPHPRECISGDVWAVRLLGDSLLVLAADGLGHGPQAADAAQAARVVFLRASQTAPAELVERTHAALASTRGAAVAIAEFDRRRRLVRFAGIGNISGTIAAGDATRSMVSHHGTAGHDVARIQEWTYPWPGGALGILHSDGLSARWKLSDYPGLAARHPLLIAGMLYRDHRRGSDDASIVVIREAA
jgi:hypothetical protein